MEASTIKVVLIDDEPDLLEISKQFLELDRNISVDTIGSALLAIDLIALQEYDVVVSDYQMPGKDGIQLLKEIRAMGNLTPFILFTGKGREEVAIEALNSGADFYLQKGGDPKAQFIELSNMILKAVQRRRMKLDFIENQEKFENIFNSANDSIHILDLEGRILEINDVGCSWLGYTKQEMLRKNVRDVDTEVRALQFPAHLKEALEKGFALFESEWIAKSGQIIPIEISARSINYAGQPAILGVARNITERKKAATALAASKALLCETEKIGKIGGWTFDAETLAQTWTEETFRILEIDSNEGEPTVPEGINFVAPTMRLKAEQAIQRAIEFGEPYDQEWDIITAKGNKRWVRAIATAHQEQGKTKWVSGSFQDITERRRAEEALREIEARFEQLAEHGGTVIWEIAADGLFTYVGYASEAIWGYHPDELVGKKHFYDLTPDAEREPFSIMVFEMMKRRELFVNLVNPVMTGDGRVIWVSTNGIPLLNPDGTLRGYQGSDTDITARKQTEEALRISEKRYHQLFDHIGTGVAVYEATEDGRDFIFRDFNRGAQDIDKIGKEEVIGRKLTEVFPGVDEMGLLDVLRRVYLTGNPESYPTSLYQDDRITGYRENCVYRLPSGELVALYEDTTARKEAEMRIEHLASFPALNPDPVLELKVGAGITYANESSYRIIREMGKGDDISLLIPKDIEDIIKTLKDSEVGHIDREVEVGGRVFQTSVLNVPETDLVRIYGTDITQRRHAEETLLESEKKFHSMFDLANDAILLHPLRTAGASNQFIEANQVACSMLGYSKEELLSLRPVDIVPPEFHPQLVDIIRQVQTKDKFLFETMFQRKDGTTFPVESSAHLFNYEGKSIWISHIRDISERKKAEEALQESEKRFKNLFDAMNSGVAIYAVRNDGESGSDYITQDFNAKALEIEGKSKVEVVGRSLLDLRPTINSYGLIPIFRQVWKTGEPAFYPSKVYVDEHYFNWYENTVFRLPSGEIVAIYNDVTDRMRMTEELRESEEKFRVISESSPDHIVVHDSDLRYVWVLNPQLGLTQSDMIGKTDYDFLPKHDADNLTSAKKEVMKSGKEMRFNTSLPSLDGGKEYFDGVFIPRHDSMGRTDGIIGYFRNVTETMHAQKELSEVNRKLNLLSSITRHDINNQLMALTGNLALLKMKQSDLASDSHFLQAEAVAERISTMIKFTKEYEDIGVHPPIMLDVKKLVDKGVKEIALGSIKVLNDVPKGTEVYADPLIAKVFHNLIDNSVRHGGKVTTIHFFLEEHDGVHAIVCEDDGIGVPAEMKEKIFTRGSDRSHGYGLFLSREILAITGMTIMEDGESGRGAKFIMTGPIRKAVK